jgi:uncharacterized protein YtpQ (UPF0354 family)
MLRWPSKSFVHPADVYNLEYSAHWDQVQQDEGRSCGFGPHERDDVGLWISILPMSVDTGRLIERLPKVMEQMVEKTDAANVRLDATLRHYALKADCTKDGEGGHFRIIAGGDVVLFASSQVPIAERDEWNPRFEQLMASLQITRDDELFHRKLAVDVLEEMRNRHPDQEFEFDDKDQIRGHNQIIHLSNIYREVKASPGRRKEILRHFVQNIGRTLDAGLGEEVWEETRCQIIPVLKPRASIKSTCPTKDILTREWLADVLICYVIRRQHFCRFVTGWDVSRWGTAAEELHDLSVKNLVDLSWRNRLEGSRQPDGGRVIIVETGDSLASSRLLNPELHRLFSGPLGNPFWAGIPDRDTLVLYSERRSLKQRIPRRLKKDYQSSAYPITPNPFLVTADGIAPSVKEPKEK